MKREQHQQDLGLASKTIRGAKYKNAVLKDIASDVEGVDRVLETQEEMVSAMAASNLARQQQSLSIAYLINRTLLESLLIMSLIVLS